MKKVLIALCLMALVGCESSAKQYKPEVLPDELADCKFYVIADGGSYMRVVRCPNSNVSLSYKSGKTTKYVAVVEE